MPRRLSTRVQLACCQTTGDTSTATAHVFQSPGAGVCHQRKVLHSMQGCACSSQSQHVQSTSATSGPSVLCQVFLFAPCPNEVGLLIGQVWPRHLCKWKLIERIASLATDAVGSLQFAAKIIIGAQMLAVRLTLLLPGFGADATPREPHPRHGLAPWLPSALALGSISASLCFCKCQLGAGCTLRLRRPSQQHAPTAHILAVHALPPGAHIHSTSLQPAFLTRAASNPSSFNTDSATYPRTGCHHSHDGSRESVDTTRMAGRRARVSRALVG